MKSFLRRKTHYEVILPYLKTIKYDMDMLAHLSKIEYPEGLNFKQFQELMQIVYPTLSNLNNIAFMYYSNIFFHFCQLKRTHEKVYYIAPQLAARLADTNLNIDSRFLKSPFKEIYIQIDKGLFQIIDTNTHKLVSVEGLYVYFYERSDGIKEIRIMAVAILDPTPELPVNDSIFYFRYELSDGKLQDIVHKHVQEQLKNNTKELEASEGILNLMYIETLANFVFNVLLYITSKEPDIINILSQNFKSEIDKKSSKKKLKKILQRYDRYSDLPYILVGSRIEGDKDNLNSIEKAGNIVKWRLEKRIYVEGHWRLQWYGSEKDNSRYAKHIFISPFYKGPELAEIINKKYQVGVK